MVGIKEPPKHVEPENKIKYSHMLGDVNFHTLVFAHGWKMKAEALSPLHPPIRRAVHARLSF